MIGRPHGVAMAMAMGGQAAWKRAVLVAAIVASANAYGASGVGQKEATARLNFRIVIQPVLRVSVPPDGQIVVATNMQRAAVSARDETIYEKTLVASSGQFEIKPAFRYVTGALP